MKTLNALIISILTACAMLTSCQSGSGDADYPVIPVQYPPSRTEDQTDIYFGKTIADPYRWLEFDTAAEVIDWVKRQNEVTFGYLDKIPFRRNIRARLEELWNYPKYSAPFREGDYFFFYKNDGLQNQSVLYFQKGIDGSPEVFIDPNALSQDGTTALASITFSKDHKYAAYSIAKAGSDWNEIFVMEVATKKLLDDHIRWVKFSSAAWKGNGFYYSRYDEPGKGTEFSNQNRNQKVYYHTLGDPQSKDKLVFEDAAHPLRYYGPQVTEDERYLILNVAEGTRGDEIRIQDLSKPGSKLEVLIAGFANNHSVIDNEGDALLVRTDLNAPRYRVVKITPGKSSPSDWEEVIPQKEDLLQSVNTAGGHLFAGYLKDASDRVIQFSRSGQMEREIVLPGIGTIGGFGGEKEAVEIFYTFTSFIVPPTIYRYDIEKGSSEEFRKTEVKFDASAYETKQVFYTSKDGTKIPMFLIHKKGIELNGKNPTYLYGYGGFNISLTPSFSPSRIVFLEHGGVVAIANLRGGGEYGEDWHNAGMLEKKQNVFDDFISAAEFLIQEKYTSASKLAIAGGSNGGLLVGACMTQRPDLFAVALPAVGVLDMLRFHKFTVGWGWVVEYGSSEDSVQFNTLLKYSPLHNLKKGTSYPATMITTADHDDRVVPAHSFKFAAALQASHEGERPVLIRVDVNAGHGAGKPTSKILDEHADIWSFVLYNTRSKVTYEK
jgi:prolyl oligopeptidase